MKARKVSNESHLDSGRVERVEDGFASQWFMVVNQNGDMHCSCGRSLTKMDDGTFRCDGGYPIYRPSNGEVMIDKFGNYMLKVMPHSNKKRDGSEGLNE